MQEAAAVSIRLLKYLMGIFAWEPLTPVLHHEAAQPYGQALGSSETKVAGTLFLLLFQPGSHLLSLLLLKVSTP